METPAWKYGAALIGVIAAGVLAVCNVLAAYNAWEGEIERAGLAIVMFVIVDLGVIAFLFGAVWLHRNGHPWEAAVFAVLWAGASIVSVMFAATYIDNRFASAQAPVEAKQIANQNAYDEWRTRLETEREHLRAAEQQSLVALKQTMREDAKAEAEASRRRIREIEAEDAGKPRVVVNAPIKHELAGHGFAAAFVAWVISQGVWFGIAASNGAEAQYRAVAKQVHISPLKVSVPPVPPSSGTKFPVLAIDNSSSMDSTNSKANSSGIGRGNHVRSIDDDTVAEILRLKEAGKLQKEIATILKIGPATVSRYIKAAKDGGDRKSAALS
jgi:DNA-binding CsgD family transcriptional regulator